MWNYPTHIYVIIHAKPKLRLANDFRDRRPYGKANCQQNVTEIPLYQENSLMATGPVILFIRRNIKTSITLKKTLFRKVREVQSYSGILYFFRAGL